MIYTVHAPTVAGYGDVALTAIDQLAGAISNLSWSKPVLGAKEFLRTPDHGQGLQSAVSFDGLGEALNPTEAGAAADGAYWNAGTSRLLLARAGGAQLATACQMAYWNPVGPTAQKRSNVHLSKQVTLCHGGVWNAIEYLNSFILPEGEQHQDAQFEVLTGYMPSEFSRFEGIYRGQLVPIDHLPDGEQDLPLVFSTADGEWAMGVYCRTALPRGGYGRWFKPEGDNCVKWNVVTRVANPVPGSVHDFDLRIAFGSRLDALQTLAAQGAG